MNNDIVQNDECWELGQLQILRKVILTVSEMVVFSNYSKQHVLDQINIFFCLEEGYGEILWNIVKENESQLWKYLMVMRSERIEEKLDVLLELIQSSH